LCILSKSCSEIAETNCPTIPFLSSLSLIIFCFSRCR
jgi:hypothetical protein